MTIPETVLIFVGSPVGIIAVLVAAVFGKSAMHQPNRYRPGRPWTYPASWFSAHPDVLTAPAANPGKTTATGGASGEW